MKRTHLLLLLAIACSTSALPAAPRRESLVVDFAAALKGLNFDPAKLDGNAGASMAANGIPDALEMAVAAAILADGALDLSASGGVTHRAVHEAYAQALVSAVADTASLARTWPSVATVVSGYALLGRDSFAAFAAMSASFQAPLAGDYSQGLALERFLGPLGDADGDGFTNLEEHEAAASADAYLAAVLDPQVVPVASGPTVYWCPMRGKPCEPRDHVAPGACPSCGMRLVRKAAYEAQQAALRNSRKRVGIVLYPGFEVLDVYGPLELWSYVPEFELVLVAEKAGPVRSAQGAATVVEHSFADAPPLDILMVPGGMGTLSELGNEALLRFLREHSARAELTTSVCSGSMLLAAAGVLDGRRATSNKLYFAQAVQQRPQVKWQARARWVDDGNIVTSSGVSAGMDMALHVIARLYGEPRATEVARWAEYVRNGDPENDPFAASTTAR